ncbi:hypothetical protein ANTQUA_LOCUS3874 [Anthophora quadrimaculata]
MNNQSRIDGLAAADKRRTRVKKRYVRMAANKIRPVTCALVKRRDSLWRRSFDREKSRQKRGTSGPLHLRSTSFRARTL